MARVLVTGGAGFLGGCLTKHLLEAGHDVRVLDNLDVRTHGPQLVRPPTLNDEVELLVGDVQDAAVVRRALRHVDVVYHLASFSTAGTRVVLEESAKRSIGRFILASSMCVYGEGLYADRNGNRVSATRRLEDLNAGRWEPRDAAGQPIRPVPTPEWKTPCLESVDALRKYDQEWLAQSLGRRFGISTIVLRIFNAYGPQSHLRIRYSRVLTAFATCLLQGRRPRLFEDGQQVRDFIHVEDVARAFLSAMNSSWSGCVNVGSGEPSTMTQVALTMALAMGRPHLRPVIAGEYRSEDARHCYADMTKAARVLRFAPRVPLERGIHDVLDGIPAPLVLRPAAPQPRWVH